MSSRIAVLFVMCSIVLSVVGESASAQNSATKQATQSDDIAKSIAESVTGTLQFAEGNFLGVAEAMPEDKYSYIPAGGNFEFQGKKPPEDCEKGGHDPAKTKAELIKYLKDSFDYSNRVLATLTAKNALDRVEGRYAGPNTKLGISVIAVWHITDHYGQLVAYLRLNGIVNSCLQGICTSQRLLLLTICLRLGIVRALRDLKMSVPGDVSTSFLTPLCSTRLS